MRSQNLLFAQEENKKPLSQRKVVLSHPKFNNFTREEAEKFLWLAEVGEYIVRPCSTDIHSLVCTFVYPHLLPTNNGEIPHKNSNGHYLFHKLISPAQSDYQYISEARDPVQVLIEDIEKALKPHKNNNNF